MGQFFEPPGGTVNPLTALGDVLYGGAAGVQTRLPGNTTPAQLVLTQTGDGTNSAAPSWQPLPSVSTLTYMLANLASSIATYKQAVSIDTYTAGALGTIVTNAVSNTPVLLGVFATNTGYPNLTTIPVGLFTGHFETKLTAGPPNSHYCYFEIWKRTAGGAETKLLTSDNTTATTTTGAYVQQTTTAVNASTIAVNTTDLLLMKIYGVAVTGGGGLTITLGFDDTTNARLEVPGSVVDATTFIPYAGATKSADMGTNNFNAANLVNVNTLTINTTGGTTTLSAAQGRNSSFEVTGVLVSNATIIVPDFMAPFTAENLTTGAFTVTFKTAAGAGVIVPQTTPATIVLLYCDGVDCEQLTQNAAGVTASTWANLPAPGTVTTYTQQYFVTDYPGGAQVVYSDGTKWKTVNREYYPTPVIDASPATTTSVTEVIIKSVLLPAGFLKVGDVVRWGLQYSKSNNTNAQSVQARIGTAGTTADTPINLSTATTLTAANQNGNFSGSFVVMSATQIAVLETSNVTTTTRLVTIPNISNALYLDYGISNATSTATTITEEGYMLGVIK
jgi:hypothetical protein